MKNLLKIFGTLIFMHFIIACDKNDETPDDPNLGDCTAKNLNLETELTDSPCGSSEGSISAVAMGAEGNFQYQLNEGSFQNSGLFEGLKPGNYKVTARDPDNCTVSENVSIISGISFQNSIKSIIDTNCAISGCHVSGTGRADFTSFNNIKQNASNVKAFTQTKIMPQTGSLTDAEIEMIACWVDDGALNN